MTEQERIRLLLDMQEHSENYTDEQLDQLLQDEELAALLEEMAQTKRALMHSELNHSSRVHLHSTLYKIAASFIGILLVSGIAFAAIRIWSQGGEKAGAQLSSDSEALPLTGERGEGLSLPLRGELERPAIIFDNVPLDSIAFELATYYNKVADIRSARARDVRLYYKWHREESLSTVVSDLNHFDRVNIAIEDDTLIVKP